MQLLSYYCADADSRSIVLHSRIYVKFQYFPEFPGASAHRTVFVVLKPFLDAVQVEYMQTGSHTRNALDGMGTFVANTIKLLLAYQACFFIYFPSPSIFRMNFAYFHFSFHWKGSQKMPNLKITKANAYTRKTH